MDFDEIIAIMEKIASPALTAEWDNSGVQINTGKKEIKRILVALEIINDVIDEAKKKKADLIITHHPLLFSPLHKVDCSTVVGNYVIELIKAGISVYSSHTNFDEAEGGNNDYIASLLKLVNIRKFGGNVIGSVGELPEETPFQDVCSHVKASLKPEQMNVVGNSETKIRKVGVCSGAGSNQEMIDEAVKLGCEVYITGDVRYHDARYALEKGLCLIDAGHYGTEKFFVQNLASKLAEMTGSKVEIISSEVNADPFGNMFRQT